MQRQKSNLAAGVAEGDQVFSQDSHSCRRTVTVGKLARTQNRLPVMPQQ